MAVWVSCPATGRLSRPLLNLVGLGRKCTSPLGFIILRMQVRETAGYDEDVVFLKVPNKSKFSCRVPLVIGTCTIGRIINVIRESEIDSLYTLGHGTDGTAAFLSEEHGGLHLRECGESPIRRGQWGIPGSGRG